jgi:hypothetical protein
MNWREDPQIMAEIQQRGVRGRLIRSAVLWTPLFLAAAVGLLYFFVDTAFLDGAHGGTWVLVVVLAVLATLFGFQSVQSLMDLRAKPVEQAGWVTRRWSRSDSIVMRSHYIRIGKRILRGDTDLLANIKQDDWVEVKFYPHSAVIVWVEKAEPPEGEVLPGGERD